MHFRIDFHDLLFVLMLWLFVAAGVAQADDQYNGNLQHVLGLSFVLLSSHAADGPS